MCEDTKMLHSLFIGRFQPLHDGHIRLIQSVIDEGKRPLIALRDTGINESNPHTIEERTKMFRTVFGDKVTIITIPDISEVVYGRGVGWGIREIRLDEKTESISATSIRAENGD